MASSMTPSYAQVHEIGAGGQGAAPTMPELATPELPEQERPEYDESKVQSLAQQHAAPGVRTLREAYQTAASRLPSNPQSRLTLKDALKGYGTGLESVMGGARKTARAEYGQEFGADVKFAGQKYAAQVAMAQQQMQTEAQAQLQQFQMSYADYLDRPESRGGGHYVSGGYKGATWVEPYTNY
jgi:hypothetical protein